MASGSALALVVTPTSSGTDLANAIAGSGVSISGVSYSGVANQSATFTGGIASGVGFESGILMTTGNVNQVPGPNNNTTETVGGGGTSDDISTSLGTPGYGPLSAIAGYNTYDAAVLSFNFLFDSAAGGDLYFNFVFASEEYVNWIGTQYNDVFGFFVDGVNIALVPGDGPITINNINNTSHSAYYKNNVNNFNGIPNLGLDLSFDGLTVPMTASLKNLSQGPHTMVFAIADTSDGILDAGIFIQAGTFSNNPTPVSEPSSLLLFGSSLAGLAFFRMKK